MVVIVLLIAVALVFMFGQAVWSLCCVGLINLVRPAGKRAKWIAISIPLFIPTFIIALIIGIWSIWPDKNDAYETVFGMPPSSTVVVHEGDVSGFADSVTVELYFTATPTDIQKLVSNGFAVDNSYTTQYPTYPATIVKPVPLQGKTIYTGPAPFPVFEDEALLVVDPATNEAWYFFDGVH